MTNLQKNVLGRVIIQIWCFIAKKKHNLRWRNFPFFAFLSFFNYKIHFLFNQMSEVSTPIEHIYIAIFKVTQNTSQVLWVTWSKSSTIMHNNNKKPKSLSSVMRMPFKIISLKRWKK